MKQVPYNTGKVLIGCRYDEPMRNHMTPEGEWMQSVLLGEYQHAKREAVRMVWYVVALVGTMCLIGWFA